MVASHVAPTGDLARNPGLDWESNRRPLVHRLSLHPLSLTSPGKSKILVHSPGKGRGRLPTEPTKYLLLRHLTRASVQAVPRSLTAPHNHNKNKSENGWRARTDPPSEKTHGQHAREQVLSVAGHQGNANPSPEMLPPTLESRASGRQTVRSVSQAWEPC